ncbi:hypothetical protein D3C72_2104120 [compost metagenome]
MAWKACFSTIGAASLHSAGRYSMVACSMMIAWASSTPGSGGKGFSQVVEATRGEP